MNGKYCCKKQLKQKRIISIIILLCLAGIFFSCYEGDDTCYVCVGTGKCPACYFEKPIDGESCRMCKGSGICVNCQGSGRIPTRYPAYNE